MSISEFIKKNIWIIAMAIGFVGFLLVFYFIPRRSQIDASWQMYCKILLFTIIVIGIAFFPNTHEKRQLILLVPIIIIIGFILPRISFFANVGIPAHYDGKLPNAYDEFYTYMYLVLFPFVISFCCLSYRLGGGLPGEVIKIGMSAVIILFSGTLDIMYFTINPVVIPEKMIYANHIKAILGYYPTFGETMVFFSFHLPLLVILWLLPLNKWIKNVFGKQYAEKC